MNCLNCGKETKNPKFCSKSCSATYNNKGIRRHGKSSYIHNCLNCGKETKNPKFCSKKCSSDYRYKENIKNWLNGNDEGYQKCQVTRKFIKKWLIEQYGNRCQKCGWSETNPYTGNVPIELEHIDGDWRNNKPENLTLLCPNCHSLTPTYKALNIGNGRDKRYKK